MRLTPETIKDYLTTLAQKEGYTITEKTNPAWETTDYTIKKGKVETTLRTSWDIITVGWSGRALCQDTTIARNIKQEIKEKEDQQNVISTREQAAKNYEGMLIGLNIKGYVQTQWNGKNVQIEIPTVNLMGAQKEHDYTLANTMIFIENNEFKSYRATFDDESITHATEIREKI